MEQGQPFIKVSAPQAGKTQAEIHAYQPEEAPIKEEKTVGNMNEEEFMTLLVKGIIQADKVKASLQNEEFEQEEENRGPGGKVLGTIGDVAHGALDIVEGVARGAVDIVTFGKAKRR
jgi:ribosomal protein S16